MASRALSLLFATLLPAAAQAEWKAASEAVSTAAKDKNIAAVLDQVNRLDRATIDDDRQTFSALLAPDLVVNNPQNEISRRGGTAQRSQAGLISYSAYSRSIEHAGKLGDMVLLMGDEQVTPKNSSTPIRRCFTDVWRKAANGWVLAARQATVVPQP